eukprot:13319128-Alexandrium_andersonii.AAC.1
MIWPWLSPGACGRSGIQTRRVRLHRSPHQVSANRAGFPPTDVMPAEHLRARASDAESTSAEQRGG